MWGAKYKAVTFDPKAEFERCETLMLDMDGTILDLAYDNFMWLTHVPQCWAEINGMPVDEARAQLFARYGKIQGELHWYCLDHWSERLGLDVMQLHRDNHERIGYLPGAREFLEVVRQREITVLLVTNSPPDTLQLKDEGRYKDGLKRVEKNVVFAEALAQIGIEIKEHNFVVTEEAKAKALAKKIETKGSRDERVDVHAESNANSEVVAKVPGNLTFTIIKKEADWYLIQLLGGKEGYVHKDNVKLKD